MVNCSNISDFLNTRLRVRVPGFAGGGGFPRCAHIAHRNLAGICYIYTTEIHFRMKVM